MYSQDQIQISTEIKKEKQILSSDNIQQDSQEQLNLNNKCYQDNILDIQNKVFQKNDSNQQIVNYENMNRIEQYLNQEQEYVKKYMKQNDKNITNKNNIQNSQLIYDQNLIQETQQNSNDDLINKDNQYQNEVDSTKQEIKLKTQISIEHIENNNMNNTENTQSIENINQTDNHVNSRKQSSQSMFQGQTNNNNEQSSTIQSTKEEEIIEDTYNCEDSFNNEEDRKMIEDLNQRIIQLYQQINEAKKNEQIQAQDQYMLKYINFFTNKIFEQSNCNIKAEELSNEFVKQRAYELLSIYHSEIEQLKQQNIKDSIEIQNLKSIIKNNDIQNKILTEQIKDLQNQLKQQLIKQNDEENRSFIKNRDLVHNQQNIQKYINSPININQVQSIYQEDSKKTNTLQKDSDSANKDSFEENNTKQTKNKQIGVEETQTSFNLSPSPIKYTMILKKLQDPFNKKRLSETKEQNHNIQIEDQNICDNSRFDINSSDIQKQEQQIEDIAHCNKQNQNINKEQENVNPPSIKVKTYAIKLRNSRTNSLIGNTLDNKNRILNENKIRCSLNVDDEEDSFWNMNIKDNRANKLINIHQNQTKQKNQFNISQNKSLWINSIDFQSTGYFKDTQTNVKLNQNLNEGSITLNNSLQQQLRPQKQSYQLPQQKPKGKQNRYGNKYLQDEQYISCEINRDKGENKNNQNIRRTKRSVSTNQPSNIKLDPLKPLLKQVNNNYN